MSVQEVFVGEEFEISRTLGSSFSIWLRKLPTFIVLAVASCIPLIAVGYLLFGGIVDLQAIAARGSVIAVGVLFLGVWVACYQLLTAAITYAVIQQLRSRPASVVACLGVALKRVFPVVVTGIIASVLIVLGLVLLVVPGVMLATMYSIVVPVCVAEDVSFWPCLTRSAALTKGHRWQIFAMLFLLAIGQFAIQKIVELLFHPIVATGQTPLMMILGALELLIAQFMVATFMAVVAACTYYYLRMAKEGVDIDQIAAVFD